MHPVQLHLSHELGMSPIHGWMSFFSNDNPNVHIFSAALIKFFIVVVAMI
jgi:hypothetical protein